MPTKESAEPMVQLLTAWNAVMAKVERVEKVASGGGLNYKYASESDIIEAIRPHMVAQGLMLAPSGIRERVHSTFLIGKNKTEMSRTDVIVCYRLYHIGGASIDIEVMGCGMDNTDKDPNKAMTGAKKYALLQAFLLSTGDDPDAEQPSDQSRSSSGRSGASSERTRGDSGSSRGRVERTGRTGDSARGSSSSRSATPAGNRTRRNEPETTDWLEAYVDDGELKEGGMSGHYLRYKLEIDGKMSWVSCFEMGAAEAGLEMNEPEHFRGECWVKLTYTEKDGKTFTNIVDIRKDIDDEPEDLDDDGVPGPEGLSPGG